MENITFKDHIRLTTAFLILIISIVGIFYLAVMLGDIVVRILTALGLSTFWF